MKKFFAVTVVGLSLAFGFTSCSDDDDSSSGEDTLSVLQIFSNL